MAIRTAVRGRCAIRSGVAREVRGMALTLPDVPDHPNRVPFSGVLTLVDVASDKPPSGARGHRVILRRDAAEAALPSLLGMAVDFTAAWDGHDARKKCGILTGARLEGNALHVTGYLFGRDFPEIEKELASRGDRAMGMSYELANAHVEDMKASVWTLERVTFTGAAILLRDKAAYRNTRFSLDAPVRACRTPVRRSARTRAQDSGGGTALRQASRG